MHSFKIYKKGMARKTSVLLSLYIKMTSFGDLMQKSDFHCCVMHCFSRGNDVGNVIMLDLIADNCKSVTKLEFLDNFSDGVVSIDRITTLKQLTTSRMMNTCINLENLMELQVFEVLEDDLLDMTHTNCPKLVKLIHDQTYMFMRDHELTFDDIKAFVQECCNKDCINHVEINCPHLGSIDDHRESLVQLVNTLPKIDIFKINQENVLDSM
jgi:hypothetical protein